VKNVDTEGNVGRRLSNPLNGRIAIGTGWIWRHLVGRRLTQSLIRTLSRLGNVDLLKLSYQEMGLLKYENSYVSGEHYLIFTALRRLVTNRRPTLFDVGANRGDYSRELRSAFPEAEIYAFEPNPYTFELLRATLSSAKDHTFCLGLGSAAGTETIYTYDNALDSVHATVCRDVFNDVHHASNIAAVDIQLTTIDQFCKGAGIKHIDVLKIDTEGYELHVLRGAARMLNEDRVDVIQFEFNGMHVISRVFLRDFYEVLKAYDIYRLDTSRLIPLPNYDVRNEIFQFQNFVAIAKRLTAASDGRHVNPSVLQEQIG
jgi:FkbM family methyltransferase